MKIPFYIFFYILSDRCTAHNGSSILISSFCLFVTDTKRMIAKEGIYYCHIRISSRLYQICRPVGAGSLGTWSQGTPILADQLTRSQPGGQIMWCPCPHPSGFSDLRAALICKYLNNVLKIVKYTAFWCHVPKWTVCLCGTVGNGGEGSMALPVFGRNINPITMISQYCQLI